MSGATITTNPYSVLTTDTTAIYRGDVVELTGTGKIVQKSAAANADNIGVFAGCEYDDANGKRVFSKYWPGVSDSKTNIVAYVWDDPHIIWECQADGCTSAEVGTVCDWNVGTGNTKSGLSGLYAVVSGLSATTGGSLRVVGLVDRPDNAYGSYAKIEVQLIEHVANQTISGLGGI
jgi:hypothetical protein